MPERTPHYLRVLAALEETPIIRDMRETAVSLGVLDELEAALQCCGSRAAVHIQRAILLLTPRGGRA